MGLSLLTSNISPLTCGTRDGLMADDLRERISLITDEYSADPATAFELGRQWGVEHYEIRGAYRFRAPVGPAWVADRVAAAVADYGVTITAISPGLFKPTMRTDGSTEPISADAPAEVRRHLDELLPAFFAFAEAVGTRNITVFALPRGDAPPDAAPPAIVIDSLAQAAERAAAGGLQLLLENGGGTWACSAEETAAILAAVGSPALKLTWDPANVAYAALDGPDPVADGYPLIRPHVANVHVKDVAVVEDQPRWCMIGDGLIDWPTQLAQLRADGYPGRLTLEPHLQYEPGRDLDLVAMQAEYLRRTQVLAGG